LSEDASKFRIGVRGKRGRGKHRKSRPSKARACAPGFACLEQVTVSLVVYFRLALGTWQCA